MVEANSVSSLRGGLERRGLADIVEKDAPGESWRSSFGEPFEHHPRVNPHVAFRMILRRLRNAFHGGNLWQDLAQEARFFEQFEATARCAFGQ